MSGSSEKKDVLCKQVTLIIKKYREKFGEDSLDRCIEFMLDPILPVNSDETLEFCLFAIADVKERSLRNKTVYG